MVLELTFIELFSVNVMPRLVFNVNEAVVFKVPPPKIILSTSVDTGAVPRFASALTFKIPPLIVVPE